MCVGCAYAVLHEWKIENHFKRPPLTSLRQGLFNVHYCVRQAGWPGAFGGSVRFISDVSIAAQDLWWCRLAWLSTGDGDAESPLSYLCSIFLTMPSLSLIAFFFFFTKLPVSFSCFLSLASFSPLFSSSHSSSCPQNLYSPPPNLLPLYYINISKHPLLLICRDTFVCPGETMLLPQFDISLPSPSLPLYCKGPWVMWLSRHGLSVLPSFPKSITGSLKHHPFFQAKPLRPEDMRSPRTFTFYFLLLVICSSEAALSTPTEPIVQPSVSKAKPAVISSAQVFDFPVRSQSENSSLKQWGRRGFWDSVANVTVSQSEITSIRRASLTRLPSPHPSRLRGCVQQEKF